MIQTNTTYGTLAPIARGVLSRRTRIRKSGLVLAVCAALLDPQRATANTSEMCDLAARQAAAQTGVPISVLKALTRSETGRPKSGELRPWPWTVNMEGEGRWFASRDEALNYVRGKYDVGARSFDVGCFQINYKWHGSAFSSISEMFDPEINALYAARFLKKLYRETNDWSAAAGAYHSRTKKYATPYRNRFDKILASNSKVFNPDIPSHEEGKPFDPPKENNYPLLQSSSRTAMFGSLVPLAPAGGATSSLFAMNGS